MENLWIIIEQVIYRNGFSDITHVWGIFSSEEEANNMERKLNSEFRGKIFITKQVENLGDRK